MGINKKNENEPMDSLDSMNGVTNIILSAFNVPDEPITPLGPTEIEGGSKLRGGLDKNKIYSAVVAEITGKCGIPTGDVFADGPNANDKMILLIIDKIIEGFHLDSVVNVSIPAGIPVEVVGPNGTSLGATTFSGFGNGIIR